ncbi:hypothetical protein [Cellulosimicrobium marinum]|uniref:hypothetical protein n=1 Tax=Cellulosimicrobium marinum TaxID=1638992 RepID=UPI001E2B8330|nr:hypothetical protein [Cellulosimicrobium marinum]MCB7137255.1 hypothetical protein [Cellulosimicrobium marinum]
MAAPNAQPDSPQPDDAPEPPAHRGADDLGSDTSDDPAPARPGGGRPADDERDPADAAPAPAEGRDEDAREDLDVEARWAGIVAELGDLDATAPGRDGPGPGDDAASGAAGPRDLLGSVPVAPWVRAPGPRDWPTTPEVEAIEEAESHFVPPDPPLVLGRDPLLTMAWSAVVGVPVVLLVLLVVARPFPVVAAQVGAGAFLAALAVLLWRMPHRRDEEDQDPGAVV